VQFFYQALADHPAIPSEIEAGKFETLHAWLTEKIHAQGKKYTPTELTRRITGDEIQAEPFISYVEDKYSQIYNL
jgi:carboxypeptidase Taq